MSSRNVIAGSTLALAASLGLGAPATAADVYELDPAHTDIVFMVSPSPTPSGASTRPKAPS